MKNCKAEIHDGRVIVSSKLCHRMTLDDIIEALEPHRYATIQAKEPCFDVYYEARSDALDVHGDIIPYPSYKNTTIMVFIWDKETRDLVTRLVMEETSYRSDIFNVSVRREAVYQLLTLLEQLKVMSD